MERSVVSARVEAAMGSTRQLYEFFSSPTFAARTEDPRSCDFVFGNPHEMPLEGFVEALGRWHVPRDKDWFAYKNNEQPAREAVAATLKSWRGVSYEPEDIHLTTGAFSALAVVLCTLLDQGDEVIYISPPWFFYEGLILAYGGRPVRVQIDPTTFDLDLDAIAAAITPRTRAIIVNSPHNPTGKIYPPETLRQLAGLLSQARERHGNTIYLLSDEAYSRIIYDERPFHSPTTFYPHSFLIYTYGKTLLTPGQRIGYIALSPAMPAREQLRDALFVAEFLVGYCFPNALMQYALPELERLSIDIGHLQRKRDLMVAALRERGYELHVPEGTFYLLPRSPLPDDLAFAERLARHNVFVLPGSICEAPGFFRISITANDAMIERSLAGFAAAIRS